MSRKQPNRPAPKGKRPPGSPGPPRIKEVVVGGQLFRFNQDEIDRRIRENERDWMRAASLSAVGILKKKEQPED